MMVTHEQAGLCADFMAEQEPAEIAAPLSVLDALHRFENARLADDLEGIAVAINAMRVALDRWLAMDRRACVALLGPGLGLESMISWDWLVSSPKVP